MPTPLTDAELDRLAEISSIGQRLSRDLDQIKDAVERGDSPAAVLALLASARHVHLNALCRMQVLVLDERNRP